MCQVFRALNAQLKDGQPGFGYIGAMPSLNKGLLRHGCDLASAYMQLPIKEEAKHKTSFWDTNGRLWGLNACGFNLKTVAAAVPARLDDDLPVLQTGSRRSSNLLLHTTRLSQSISPSFRNVFTSVEGGTRCTSK